ncbi:hypothetical protein OE88DRAFT_1657077 [Heliocybe sulcata]|uniref:Uncharacterized protein n=1 Tax=Heliocybe sulcata TaxID=5364 RepID=A0A5C3N7E9_9AGAM|nr:hypothetical protein OE88DRAFT_1657077 [Heliocybe sulcata]
MTLRHSSSQKRIEEDSEVPLNQRLSQHTEIVCRKPTVALEHRGRNIQLWRLVDKFSQHARGSPSMAAGGTSEMDILVHMRRDIVISLVDGRSWYSAAFQLNWKDTALPHPPDFQTYESVQWQYQHTLSPIRPSAAIIGRPASKRNHDGCMKVQ